MRQLERHWTLPESAAALNAFLRNPPSLNRSEWLRLGALLEGHDAWEPQTVQALARASQSEAR